MATRLPKKGPKMNAQRRKSLPKAKFGLPSQDKYPIDSRGRAANAKGRAKQQLAKGNLSTGQYNQIVSRANKALGTGKKKRSSKKK